ncbi:MAG: leucine-rich repeat protein [Clostridia bacterium]|nr:leucine-rich repeat protein [Clostridia bacterium]
MKRRYLVLALMALIALALPLAARATAAPTSGYCGGEGNGTNLTWELTNNTLTISGTGAMANYESADNIAPWGYCYSISVDAIVVEEGVTSIGDYAFSGQGNVASVSLPSTVTTIGDNSFANCGSLESIDLPDDLTAIGDSAFYECSITEIVIPDGVTEIGEYTFYYCDCLESVALPAHLNSIGDGAFALCGELSSIALPSTLTSIGEEAFSACGSLHSVVIPASVTSIGSGAFDCGRDITIWRLSNHGTELAVTGSGSTMYEPDPAESFDPASIRTLTVDWEETFGYDDEEERYIKIEIPNAAFREYTGLENVTITGMVGTIGEMAFYQCASLETVTLETGEYGGVYTIGYSAFSGCTSLQSISIPGSVTTIDYGAFRGCSSLASVTLANGLETIGHNAFSYTSLQSITIPSSVTSMSTNIFENDAYLASITFEEGIGITAIEGYTFYNCSSLSAITIPAGVTSIGEAAFIGCTGLETVTFGNGSSLESIGNSAFDNCSNLTDVTIPSGVTSIEEYAFYGCSSLESVTFASGSELTSIGEHAFQNCSSLSIIEIPASVTTIDNSAFHGCSALESVAFGSGSKLEEIGNYCFSVCEELNGIILPNGLQTLGESAFIGCSSLTSIAIPSGMETIPSSAFYSCSSLESVTIPSSVTSIGDFAFSLCSDSLVIHAVNCTDAAYVWAEANGISCEGSHAWGDWGDPVWDAAHFRMVKIRVCANSAQHTETQEMTVSGSGNCGANGGNLTWKLYEDGTLAIQGTGAMADYVCYDNPAPWGTGVETVRFGNNVTTVGAYAFYGCASLESVSLPSGLTAIGQSAFDGCESLTSISLPSGLTTIGEAALAFTGIASITLPDSVTSIGDLVFTSCANLKTVTLPKNITAIGPYWFSLTGLESFTVPDSVTSIAESAFSACYNLQNITIPVSVTNIHHAAFEGCEILTVHCWYGSAAHTHAIDNGFGIVFLDPPPAITAQPVSITVNEDKSASFTVAAENATSYQWYYYKPGETTGTKISSGGTSETYTLNSAKPRHNGYKYYCVVENIMGSATSQTAMLTVRLKPVITTQPVNVTVNEGAMATFTVEATGGESFQWYYQKPNDATWFAVSSNGTSATYTLTTAARHNGYKYHVKVSNTAGSVWSNDVTLTVKSKPVITSQPVSVTVNEGETATFTVVATGATGYRWSYQKPGESTWNPVNNNGATETCSLTAAARHNGYQYRCTVQNDVGSVDSSAAKLTVNLKPIITTQPVNVTVDEGAKATFKVVATGGENFQWYYQKPNDATWYAVSSNGTSATYTLTTAARHNGYKYHVKVSNAAGAVWSKDVTLTVLVKPVITTQPVDQKVNEGATATFTVVATGGESFQWYYQKPNDATWYAVSNNGTSATCSLTAATRHNGYKYHVKVSNAAGFVLSNDVTLTVVVKPVITTQPTNQTVTAGKKATFTVVATDADSYKWYYQKPDDDTWYAVSSNGTSATYTLTTQSRHNGYKYRVKVSNSAGEVWSNTVTLKISVIPVITTQPTSQHVNEGVLATFKVVATGATEYQWYYLKDKRANWTAVSSNGTSATYNLHTAARHNGYQYKVKVSNSRGFVWSDVVTLTLNLKPVITSQPSDVSVGPGGKATFRVVATGAVSYQWYYQKPGDTTWYKVTVDGTSATYTLKVEPRHNKYKYKCVVTNGAGSVESGIAILTAK